MRFATYESDGSTRVGLVAGDELVDLTAELGARCDDVMQLLALGENGLNAARRAMRRADTRVRLDAVKLRPPVLRPEKLLGVGMNYHSFVRGASQLGMTIPEDPVWFYRPSSCLVGHQGDVWLPRAAQDLDYEVELAIVIGRECRDVSASQAAAVIGGFSVANDLTLRSRVAKSLVLATSFDTHTPLGPVLVTPDELGDPHRLAVRTWVNDELRQSSNTSEMITSCYELIATISTSCTLRPGDVILTGTPDGCGIFRSPPSGLTAGDTVKLEIEGVGVIANRVIDEPVRSPRALMIDHET
jgi:2-keto-4-pentenoate hydratase/2-oxohepta-3-ene-1,7-dioic acid hydratase in catechol pathway